MDKDPTVLGAGQTLPQRVYNVKRGAQENTETIWINLLGHGQSIATT